MSHSEGNAKGTNCNIAHSFQSGRFHREEGQRVSWLEGAGSVYEAGIGARSFTKRKLKFCDTLSKHLPFDNRAGYVNFHHSLSSETPLIRRHQRSLVNTTALGRTNRR